MISAIYVRKSTDQNLPDAEKSVTRQIEHATVYAARKGWTVDPAYVYQDDGISGAEFVKRPGFLRLMNALKPRPPFQVLVMSEESRLGREQIETGYALKQITDAGVRVFFYLEDRERTLGTALDKVMLSLANFASEMEREKARQRTRDALHRKAQAGHVPGGVVYGYRNVEVCGERGQRLHVRREVEPHQAAVVLRIFEAAAAGHGLRRIAKALNREAVPPPRAGGSWAPTAIREMLHRETYRGRVVWNKTGWVDRGGTKVKVDRPEAEWLVRDAPELRIVSEALWQAAHGRIRDTVAAYHAVSSTWGRPPVALRARYLLTGFTECGVCRGSMLAWRRTEGHGPTAFRCSYHHYRGARVCPNGRTVSVATATAAVLEGLRGQVLAPDVLIPAIREAVALYEARAAEPGTRRDLERSLHRLRDELDRLTAALASGASLPSILHAIKQREAQRAELEGQLAAIVALNRTARRWDRRGLERVLRQRVEEWQNLLEANPDEARQVLRQLLPGRLRFTPREAGGYEITGEAAPGGLVATVVDGTLRWCPRGDSHSFGARKSAE